MARRPATFRQSDVTRAIEGVKAAGESVGRVEVDSNGKIVVIIACASQASSIGEPGPEGWDGVQ